MNLLKHIYTGLIGLLTIILGALLGIGVIFAVFVFAQIIELCLEYNIVREDFIAVVTVLFVIVALVYILIYPCKILFNKGK